MSIKSSKYKVWMVVAACMLSAAGAWSANAEDLTPEESARLTAPLPMSDPRAQLDPSLRDVPDMEPPPPSAKSGKMLARRARRGTSYDVVKGREESPSRVRRETPPGGVGLSEGDPGFAATTPEAASDGLDVEHPPLLDPDSRVIWGADERIRITATTNYPWRAQTKLFVRFPNGKSYGCSGTLIARRYLITAGHCVHSTEDGGWASQIEAVPGFNDGYKPYGSAYATRLRSVLGWTVNRDPAHDYAVITLDRDIGSSVGWLGYASLTDYTLSGRTLHVSGYPGDRCYGRCQYYDYEPVSGLSALTILHRADTAGGQSGSGMYVILDGARYVVGPHRGTCTGGATSNCGPRINSARFDQIRGWLSSGS